MLHTSSSALCLSLDWQYHCKYCQKFNAEISFQTAALGAGALQQAAELCSQQALVCSSCFSAGEQKVLSAGAHIVAPLFIAVYSFSRHHPQGKSMCALTLPFVCSGETQLGCKVNKFLNNFSLIASSALRSLWHPPSFPSYIPDVFGFAHLCSILRKRGIF